MTHPPNPPYRSLPDSPFGQRRWLTVRQVADYLGRDYDWVLDRLREGAIYGHQEKPRAHWRIETVEVDRYVRGLGPNPSITPRVVTRLGSRRAG